MTKTFENPETGSIYTVVAESFGKRLSYRHLNSDQARVRIEGIDPDEIPYSLGEMGFSRGVTGSQEHISAVFDASNLDSVLESLKPYVS